MPNAIEAFALPLPGMWEAMGGTGDFLRRERPGMMAAAALLLPLPMMEEMRRLADGLELAFADPEYRKASGVEDAAHAGMLGLDLHLTPDGPRLIEINTNPGGLLLNLAQAGAARRLVPRLTEAVMGDVPDAEMEDWILDSFIEEWRKSGKTGLPGGLAILDEDPPSQYLWPEFLLYRELFTRAGIPALTADPGELEIIGDRLLCRGAPVDFVYNRLTDFPLVRTENAVLARAWRRGLALLVPDPPAHALCADKGNLARLAGREDISAFIPAVREAVPEMWAERHRLFFKPHDGFAGRGAYRGGKLSKGKWAEIAKGGYIAQEYVPPPVCRLPGGGEYKFDVRLYARKGRILLAAARLYDGQTTNFRTPGGGFAPIFFTA